MRFRLHKMLASTLYTMWLMHLQSCKVASSNDLGGDAFTYDTLLDVDLTQNVVHYPLHHVTYAPAKLLKLLRPTI